MSAIGTGALATVLKVTDRYAVKLVDDVNAADHEIGILEEIGECPCVVGYFGRLAGQSASGQRSALLLELCQGSLNNALLKLPGQRLPDATGLETQQAVVMLINCVAQLHSRGVIHQDIKPSNFLLGQDGAIKLCDFNLSRLASDSSRIKGGTVLYFSPHMFNNMDEGYAADWWALGVTLYQALHGLHTWPFSSRSLLKLDQAPAQQQLVLVRKAVMNGNLRFRSLSGLPRGARALIRGLLHTQPEKRWGLLHVLAGDYPGDAAFAAVAARHPQLAPDMERLLSLRRLCRLSPAKQLQAAQCESAAASAPRCEDDGDKAGRGDDDATRTSPAVSRRFLRGLSSYLLQRIISRRRACSAASFNRDADDLSQGDDQRSESRPAAAAAGPHCSSAAATTAPSSAPSTTASPTVATTILSTQELEGSPVRCGATCNNNTSSTTYHRAVGAGGGSSHHHHHVVRHRGAGSAAAAKAVAMTKSLLPRSEGAIRTAVAQAAAAAPRALLTEDGRLAAAGPHVSCEVRTDEVELPAELREVLGLHGEGRSWAGAAGSEADVGPRGRRERSCGGQVQDVEVLEEMRQLLARRVTAAAGASGRSGAGRTAGGDTGMGASSTSDHPASPSRSGMTPCSTAGGASTNTGLASMAVASLTPGVALDSSCRSSSNTATSSSRPSSLSGNCHDCSTTSRAAHLGGGLQAAFEAAAALEVCGAGTNTGCVAVTQYDEYTAAASKCAGSSFHAGHAVAQQCAAISVDGDCEAVSLGHRFRPRAGRTYSTGHGLVRASMGACGSPRLAAPAEELLPLPELAAKAHQAGGALAVVRISRGGGSRGVSAAGCPENPAAGHSPCQPAWPNVYINTHAVNPSSCGAGRTAGRNGSCGGVFNSCGMDSLFSLRGSILMEELAAPAAPATDVSNDSAESSCFVLAAESMTQAVADVSPLPRGRGGFGRHSRPVDLRAVAAGLEAAVASGLEFMEAAEEERATWGSMHCEREIEEEAAVVAGADGCSIMRQEAATAVAAAADSEARVSERNSLAAKQQCGRRVCGSVAGEEELLEPGFMLHGV
ncbi:hypothetical protein Agub_g11704, partial [Astrephomene gubernaculifera]